MEVSRLRIAVVEARPIRREVPDGTRNAGYVGRALKHGFGELVEIHGLAFATRIYGIFPDRVWIFAAPLPKSPVLMRTEFSSNWLIFRVNSEQHWRKLLDSAEISYRFPCYQEITRDRFAGNSLHRQLFLPIGGIAWFFLGGCRWGGTNT